MNICMVGYGAIAARHMEGFGQIDGVRPHVLVGRQPDKSAAFATRWGFKHHTLELDSALADPAVDAVVITSPSDLHRAHAEKSLQAGKHVLLEIPLALNYQDAQTVTALSRRADRRVMICHTMRYYPAIQEVHRRVSQNQLRIHQIVGVFGTMRRTNTTADGQPRSWTDNIHWHHGAHLVDTVLWTTGCSEVLDVHCRFGPEHPTQGVLDLALTMVLPGGLLATIAQSYNMSHFRWRILFVGEQYTLEFDSGSLLDGAGNVVIPHHSLFDLRKQDEEFVAAVREGRDPAITCEAVLPAMRVLQTAQDNAAGAT